MFGDRWLKTAYAYLYIRDFARATESFRRAIECEPDNPAYYFHASVTALRNGHLVLAHEWAQYAVNLEGDNALYQEHLEVVEASMYVESAQNALREGKYEDAVGWFQQALESDPLNTEAAASLERLQPFARNSGEEL
jgi:tetratricopeptide (TPR) repeat protein